jgi:hypothetical protein
MSVVMNTPTSRTADTINSDIARLVVDAVMSALGPGRLAFKPDEFAKAIGRSRAYIWERIRLEELRVVRRGRATLVPLDAAIEFAGIQTLPVVSRSHENRAPQPSDNSRQCERSVQ